MFRLSPSPCLILGGDKCQNHPCLRVHQRRNTTFDNLRLQMVKFHLPCVDFISQRNKLAPFSLVVETSFVEIKSALAPTTANARDQASSLRKNATSPPLGMALPKFIGSATVHPLSQLWLIFSC